MIYPILTFVFWISMCAYAVIVAREYNKKQKRGKQISSSDILFTFVLFALVPSIVWPFVSLLYIIKVIIGKIIEEKEAPNLKKIIITFLTED